MQNLSRLEILLKRDRALVAVGLAALVLLAWAYILYLAQGMADMGVKVGAEAMAGDRLLTNWGLVDFALMFLMWAVMMVAMMTPSATPMLFTFAVVHRRRRESGVAPAPGAATPSVTPLVPTGVFLTGYLLLWSAFSLAATLAQWGLHQAALLSPGMSSASPLLGGGLLLAAGAFQWTPLKYACLHRCRTPMGFMTTEWREGYRGALLMGLRHGVYCLGCCWALMSLLFVLGVMNLLWISALAVFVLAEKVMPAGHRIGRSAGLLLLTWGLWLIIGAVLD